MRPRPYLLIVLLFLSACAGQTVATQTETQKENHLLRLLSYVPDADLINLPLVYYGDIAAWHRSWGIPRIDNVEEWDNLDIHPRTYWEKILPRQAHQPGRFITGRFENQRGFYGFDLFNTERFLFFNGTALVELPSKTDLHNTLLASGYETAPGNGATLYTLPDSPQPIMAGTYRAVPKLALSDEFPLLLTNEYANMSVDSITQALAARAGDVPSLALNPAYMSAALALEDEFFEEMGELTGAVLLPFHFTPARPPTGQGVELDALPYPELPGFYVAVFATYHTSGATHEVLMLVFPKGRDALAAARVLEARLHNYVSLRYRQNLLKLYQLEIDTVTSIESAGLPVAIVTLRADDPPLEYPEDAVLVLPNTVPSVVPDWLALADSIDYGFLAVVS